MITAVFDTIGINVGYIVLALIILIIILLIMIIVLFSKLNKLDKRLSKFTSGKTGSELENIMLSKFSDIDSIVKNEKRQNKDIKVATDFSRRAFNRTGLVKYNAFKEMAGNLSFALAILSEENNGVIINAMHSREGCFTYCKEIIDGKSYVVLSDEEKQALDIALSTKDESLLLKQEVKGKIKSQKSIDTNENYM